MRFQGTLLPADGRAQGRDPRDSVRWRWTPAASAVAEAVAVELGSVALPAQIELVPNDAYEPDDVSDASEGVRPKSDGGRDDVYLEVRRLGRDDPSVAVCENGGFVVIDSFAGSEQEQHREFVVFVRAVERASGWRLTERDERMLVESAAYYGVAVDGRVEVPARITEDELRDALIRLAPRSTTAVDRPRPSELLANSALRELAPLLASHVPAEFLPATRRYELFEHSFSTSVPAHERTFQLDETNEADLVFRLWHELGDRDTGRPAEVRIHIDPERQPTVEVHFDSLPADETEPGYGYNWEGHIVTMAERQPAWIPDWVHDAITLLRAAGRGIALPPRQPNS